MKIDLIWLKLSTKWDKVGESGKIFNSFTY